MAFFIPIMFTSAKLVLRYALAQLQQNVEYYDLRAKYIGIVAVIGFPLYYFVWHDLYPQPYENFTLRLIGSLLFIPIALSAYWPSWLVRFKMIYWNCAILYGLSFFFSFMMFMNGGADVWVQSLLIAIFVMVLMMNWFSFLVHCLVGMGLGFLFFKAQASVDHVLVMQSWQFFPVIVFAVIIGIAANYSVELINAERERAILEAASIIAHELRTPLLGISAGAAGLCAHVPVLLKAYHLAQEHGLGNLPSIRAAHLAAMADVLQRIETESHHANTMVDMLLVSARGGRGLQGYSQCSMSHCVTEMLERYPFATGERDLVQIRIHEDFVFYAHELQVVHVLFNLMKNALRHIQQAGKGEIMISVSATQNAGRLVFLDTGSGVAPDILPHIFKRFYTTQMMRSKTHNWGAGIGLAFCQDVIKSLGGEIKCRSVWGDFTEFEIIFPRVQHL
jgi:two-component system CAI-1 autoinducer sensor kinase/phosphatase CqsS